MTVQKEKEQKKSMGGVSSRIHVENAEGEKQKCTEGEKNTSVGISGICIGANMTFQSVLMIGCYLQHSHVCLQILSIQLSMYLVCKIPLHSNKDLAFIPIRYLDNNFF